LHVLFVLTPENIQFCINEYQKLHTRLKECVNSLSKQIKQYAEYVVKNHSEEKNRNLKPAESFQNVQGNVQVNEGCKNIF